MGLYDATDQRDDPNDIYARARILGLKPNPSDLGGNLGAAAGAPDLYSNDAPTAPRPQGPTDIYGDGQAPAQASAAPAVQPDIYGSGAPAQAQAQPVKDDIYDGRPAEAALAREPVRPVFFGTNKWDAAHQARKQAAELESEALEGKAKIAEQQGRAKYYGQHGDYFEQGGSGSAGEYQRILHEMGQDAADRYISLLHPGGQKPVAAGFNAQGRQLFVRTNPTTHELETYTAEDGGGVNPTVKDTNATRAENNVNNNTTRKEVANINAASRETVGKNRDATSTANTQFRATNPRSAPAPRPINPLDEDKKINGLLDHDFPLYDAKGNAVAPDDPIRVRRARREAELRKRGQSPTAPTPGAPSRTTIAPSQQGAPAKQFSSQDDYVSQYTQRHGAAPTPDNVQKAAAQGLF